MNDHNLIEPIILANTFPVNKEKAWSAITDLNEMRQWFFDNIPDFKPEVGFKTTFPVQSTDREFVHLWEVVAVDPGNSITVKWQFEGFDGVSLVTFDLEEQDSGTELTLTAKETKPFPREVPEFKRESGVAGWQYFIEQELAKYLTSQH